MSSTPTLSGHVLIPATPTQDLIATKREHLEWGAPLLTQSQFITREKSVLDPTDFSRSRRQRWVLVPADDTTTEDFLCACETYRRPILFSRGEKVERGLGYSVCSVFVPESKRRMGYAGKMMTLLQMNLNPKGEVPGKIEEGGEMKGSKALVKGLDEEEGELADGGGYGGNATLSFLYSDVGEYYSKFGWSVVGNRHVEWLPLSPEDPDVELPEGARWLQPEELREIGKIDREYLLSQLQTSSSDKIRFCVDDPEATSWRWLIKRSSFYASTLLPDSAPKPSHFGLYLPPNPSSSSSSSQPSYIVWMFDYIENKISILRLRFSSPHTFSILITAVRDQAREWGMKKCVAWNLPLSHLNVQLSQEDKKRLRQGEKVEKYKKELEGGTVVERQGNGASLPALVWYADKKEGEQVEWICNEYGWWC